jgi:hypothetical protein
MMGYESPVSEMDRCEGDRGVLMHNCGFKDDHALMRWDLLACWGLLGPALFCLLGLDWGI